MKNKLLTFVLLGLLVAGFAGVAIQFGLSSFGINTLPNLAVGSVYIAVIGLLFFVLIVEIVSTFKIEDSTFHTALLAVCLIGLCLFSTDMQLFLLNFDIKISELSFGILSELCFLLITGGCCWYIMFLYNLSINRKRIFAAVGSIIILFIGYSVAQYYGYGYIIHLILALSISTMFYLILHKVEKNNKIGLTTYISAALFCFSVGMQNVNALTYNGLFAPVLGVSLVYAVLSLAMFAIVYLMFTINTDTIAVTKSKESESFKTKALSGQIKPHFIFNSLEAIRALYHEDVATGDKAMNLLSDFLRKSINSFDNDLIPFETELDNIFNYTEFRNLKRQNKIEVMFNIDYTDFSVPPFSIQPFVENALKYSGVDEMENGTIIISSYKKDNYVIVEIIDNGKGFDVSKIPENSHGIRNAFGRFSSTLGIVPEIKSTLGSGTHVKIKINLNKEKENKK
ncbi:MAG: histidine kinase [Erysipelotrichales bacterium]|nr:histidine kinase [Erysipelotrichales bacterium]